MECRKRIAIVVQRCAVAGIGAAWSIAVANAAVAPSICLRLATQMRGSPATVLEDRSAPKMSPWIITAVARPADGEPVYRYLPPVWRRMGGNGATFPTIESLPGTDLSLVSAIAGSGDCLNFTFFEWREGSALRVVGDPPMSLGPLCSREGAWGGLATVLGQPAFIAYGSLDPDNMDSLLIVAPWTGKTWGRPCPVSIRFRYRYEVTPLYCGAAKDLCNAASGVAPEVKRRYHAWDVSFAEAFNGGGGLPPRFQFGNALSPQDQAIVARAQSMGIPQHLTPASDGGPEWLHHLSPYGSVFFPLRLGRNLYVGAAARSANASTAYSGRHWLFMVFQAPNASSQRLVPLAAFTVDRVTDGVRSVEARNDSAPASDAESTRIPAY